MDEINSRSEETHSKEAIDSLREMREAGDKLVRDVSVQRIELERLLVEIRELEAISERTDEESSRLGKLETHAPAFAENLRRREDFLVAQVPLFAGLVSLDDFDVAALPKKLVDGVLDRSTRFELSKNGFYIIEIYMMFIAEGLAPPMRILNLIAAGFAKFMLEDEPDPKKLGKFLGVEGVASGSSNPVEQVIQYNERIQAMDDMATLMREYGASKTTAAKAIKERHEIAKSVGTIKRWFSEHYGVMEETVSRSLDSPGKSAPTLYERTKFISQFSPSIRKLLGK